VLDGASTISSAVYTLGCCWRKIPIALIDMSSVTPSDGAPALLMGLGFFAFGLTMILRPDRVRANFDRFADYWKQGSWHPYKMPYWGMRVAGVLIVAVAALFFQIAYIAFRH
jgi:hypothetical protein